MQSARVALAAGALTLVPCNAANGAPVPPAQASPVIVPLDVTMEDTGWLETVPALVQPQERLIAEPEALTSAAMPETAMEAPGEPVGELAAVASAHQLPTESSEVSSGVRLALLAVPSDFSITVPVEAPPSGSSSLALPASTRVQSPPARNTGTALDPRKVGQRKYKVDGSVIEFDIPVQLNGDLVGNVPLKIGPDRNVLVQLADLLELLHGRMDSQAHGWLASAYGVNSHISFDQLRSAGIQVGYDAANDTVVMAAN